MEEVQSALKHDPFVPLRLRKTDGKSISIPFKHVAVLLSYGLIVFKGVKHAQSHYATKGYEVVPFDRIGGIEPVRRATRRK